VWVGAGGRKRSAVRKLDAVGEKLPPQAYFVVSAVFHYLGPAFAVLLFSRVSVLGVAWLRIVSAAIVFGALRRPWRFARGLPRDQQIVILALGSVLAIMNCCFYLAINVLPLGTVAAIEFLGPIGLAVVGVRTIRNGIAFLSAVAGALILTKVRLEGHLLGYAFAFANMALFALYVVLGHRIARGGGLQSIDRLGVSMIVAAFVVTPIAGRFAEPAFFSPLLLLAGAAVGICSSVVPYVADQLAMARLARPTFALFLTLLPATATAIGIVVLRQVPSWLELAGVALVVIGVGIHHEVRQMHPATS